MREIRAMLPIAANTNYGITVIHLLFYGSTVDAYVRLSFSFLLNILDAVFGQ